VVVVAVVVAIVELGIDVLDSFLFATIVPSSRTISAARGFCNKDCNA